MFLKSQGPWVVEPLPEVLKDRRVDVGDVSPDDEVALVNALNSGAQVGVAPGPINRFQVNH
jgi:hypothetical protein